MSWFPFVNSTRSTVKVSPSENPGRSFGVCQSQVTQDCRLPNQNHADHGGMPEAVTGAAADAWLETNFDSVFAVEASEPLDIDARLDARDKRRNDEAKAWKKEVDANLELAFENGPPTGLAADCYGLKDDGSVITDFDLIEMDEGRWYPDMWRDAWR